MGYLVVHVLSLPNLKIRRTYIIITCQPALDYQGSTLLAFGNDISLAPLSPPFVQLCE